MYKTSFLIKIGDQDEFDITKKIRGLTFLAEDSTPQFTNMYHDVESLDGSPFVMETIAKSQVTADFWLHFNDYTDLKLAKHEIYRIFGEKKLIRIRTNTDPAKVYFCYPTPFEIKTSAPGSHDIMFSIVFDNPSGYRYSLFRSDSPYTFNQNGWQVGMNLLTDSVPNYHFTDNKFKVYNASDIKIDPYYKRHDLKIVMKYKGDSIKVTNTTNDTSFTYKKSSDKSKTLILDGVDAFLNGTNCNSDTDFGNISLETGNNSIEVSGATDIDITFSFPFIYLS